MLTLTSAEKAQLAQAADTAISNALSGVTVGWSGKAPSNEPTAVAAVVSVGLPDAARGWTTVLRPLGYRLQVVGVFCHGAPQVVFSGTGGVSQRCELADLLAVVDETSGGMVRDRRAVLVQAKMGSQRSKTLRGSDLIQLDLYQNWPAFTFYSSAYKVHARDFRAAQAPGTLRQGRDYGAIDLPPVNAGWEQIDAQNPLVMGSGQSLGAALAGMAEGSYGREAFAGGIDDWSETIDELLVTTYNAAAGGFPGPPSRGMTTIAYAAGGHGGGGLGLLLQGPSGGGPPGDIAKDGERPDGPLSLVHLRLTWEGDIAAE